MHHNEYLTWLGEFSQKQGNTTIHCCSPFSLLEFLHILGESDLQSSSLVQVSNVNSLHSFVEKQTMSLLLLCLAHYGHHSTEKC